LPALRDTGPAHSARGPEQFLLPELSDLTYSGKDLASRQSIAVTAHQGSVKAIDLRLSTID
jgi:hypothetical protein